METLRGVHHFYIGLFIGLVGFFLLWANKDWTAVIGVALIIIGFITMADDALQHTVERFWKPNYESPLKVMYGKHLYKFQLIQRLNKTADKIFGKQEE